MHHVIEQLSTLSRRCRRFLVQLLRDDFGLRQQPREDDDGISADSLRTRDKQVNLHEGLFLAEGDQLEALGCTSGNNLPGEEKLDIFQS
jgi:hypothetical protein